MVQFQKWLLVPALAAFALFALCCSSYAAEPFDEVPTDHWSYLAMTLLQEDGILDEYPADFFDAQRSLTRYEFAQGIVRAKLRAAKADPPIAFLDTLLLRILVSSYCRELHELTRSTDWQSAAATREILEGWDCNESASSPQALLTAYDDVPCTHWAYAAVNYFFKTGALEDYPKDFFKGDRTLTRYEFAQAWMTLNGVMGGGTIDEPTGVLLEALRTEFVDQPSALVRARIPDDTEVPWDLLADNKQRGSPYSYVKPESWDYRALDYLVRQRVLEGYPNNFFNGRTLTRYEITQATARLLDTLGLQRVISPELLMAEALNDKYRDQLKLLFEVIDRKSGEGIFEISGVDLTGTLEFSADESLESTVTYPQAYADVTAGHWSYYALDYLTEKGALEGYPKDFFTGDRTLTRYEFAQAVARLLDTVSSLPGTDAEGEWSVDLILAYALREEFDDQLAELSHLVNRL